MTYELTKSLLQKAIEACPADELSVLASLLLRLGVRLWCRASETASAVPIVEHMQHLERSAQRLALTHAAQSAAWATHELARECYDAGNFEDALAAQQAARIQYQHARILRDNLVTW